jgi:hypothetical protein
VTGHQASPVNRDACSTTARGSVLSEGDASDPLREPTSPRPSGHVADAVRRLHWYGRRLSLMTPAEVGWRAVSAGRKAMGAGWPERPDALLAGGSDWAAALESFRRADGRPVLLDRTRAAAIAATHPDATADLVSWAEQICAGRVQFFGYPEAVLSEPPDWNHDPVSGVRWPAIAAARLDHRTATGDVKWIWELNRLQHLPVLAQAWLLTGDDAFADTAFAHLDSWIVQNPPGVGIAWRGAFEAGVRAISVAVALQGLRDSRLLTEERYRAVLRMLAASARRCWIDRSRFSSANNHLVGELAGLAVVSLLVPELRGSGRGARRALAGLATQADRQILPDGAGAEQAFAYQVFTADLLLVVAALLRLGGRVVPPAIPAALDRSTRYLAALVGERDPVPRYGDDDEGFALRWDASATPDLRAHFAAVAAVTGDPVAAHHGRAGLGAAWLGGPDPAIGRADTAGTGETSTAATGGASTGSYAPDGGVVVLRDRGRRVTVDVGPLGYLAIAAHGHADALAVTLSVDGIECVGDPGAGSYYGHPDWRRVHRSTRVHATVTVDGQDQSVAGGPFLWTRKAVVRVRAVDLAQGIVDAEHDGYTRLAAPVRHRRWLVAPPGASAVLVVDRLTGDGHHEVRTSWPLHPALDAETLADQRAHVVRREGVPMLRISHAASVPLTLEGVHGDATSGLGWWSQRLESRSPSWLVGAVCRGSVPLIVATLLDLADRGDRGVEDLHVAGRTGGEIEIQWSGGGGTRQIRIDPSRDGAVHGSW